MKMANLTFWLSEIITIVIIGIVFAYISPILDKNIINHVEHKTRTLYVDPSFSDEEQEAIISAAIIWTCKTHYIVNIGIVFLPSKNIDATDGIIILPISRYNPDIIGLDEFNQHTTLGFFTREGAVPSINLVSSRIEDEEYQTVVLHELGHALGLKHNSTVDGIGTLMYPSINFGAPTITNDDLVNFCKLYKCNSLELTNQ